MALTKEEKKARKEAKKQEKIRLEIELKKKIRRDALLREMTAQSRRREELDKNWRAMMLKIKEPMFKQDIEVMWHTFERVYDKKNFLINHTMKLIDTADDQFQRTISSFCDTVDTMINKFLAELEEMYKENERRTIALIKYGEDDANRIMSDHNAAETHLQLLLFHAKTTAENTAWNTRGENMVKKDEECAKYTDIREDLRSFLENQFNNMWDEYKATLKAYVVGTAENQKHVRRLRRKENLMADIIASQGKKIANSDEVLKRLRTELTAYESGTKQAGFRDRRNRYRAASFQLKQRLLEGCSADEKQLGILVKASDDALDWIEAAFKKGEKILRLAALCRKFETRREKVLPYECDIPQTEVEEIGINAQRRQQQTTEESTVASAMSANTGYTKLWHRMARAELTKRALKREKALLEQQISLLEYRFQTYGTEKLTPVPTTQCLCDQDSKTKKPMIFRPVAVEGALELSKYKHWLS